MKTQHEIRRELARVKKALARTDLSVVENSELYGAQQALSWALDNDALAPARAALLSRMDKT